MRLKIKEGTHNTSVTINFWDTSWTMLLSLLLRKNRLIESSFIVEEDWLFEASSVDATNGALKLEEEQDEIQRIQAKEKKIWSHLV